MNDNDFKLKIVAEISELKADIKHILLNMPKSEVQQKEIDQNRNDIATVHSKLKFNRALIIAMLPICVTILIIALQATHTPALAK